jgi:hypothetical protein
MSAARLAQDLPQVTQTNTNRIYDERTLQDTPQYEESLRSRRSQEAREEEKQAKDEEDKRIAAEEARLKKRKKVKDTLAKIRPIPKSLKRSQVTKAAYEARERQIKSVKSRNLHYYASIGIRPTIAPMSGSAAKIVKGKIAGSGKNAKIKKQVSLAKRNIGLASGRYTYTPETWRQSTAAIEATYTQGRAKEAADRRFDSTSKAQGKASQGVRQNFAPGGKFSAQKAPVTRYSSGELIRPTKIGSVRTGTGTSTDPFRASQPDRSKVSSVTSSYQQRQSTPKGGSYIGYSPSGAPIQGAVKPTVVVTPDGKTRDFKDYDTAQSFLRRTEGSYVQKQSGSQQQQQTQQSKNNFDNFLQADDKVKTFTARGEGILEDAWTGIDKYGRSLDKQSKRFQKEKPNSVEDIVSGFNVSLYSQGASLLNLITQAGDMSDRHLLGRAVTEKKELFVPKTVAGEYIGGTAADILEGKPFKGTGTAQAEKQIKSQTTGQTGGQIAGDVIPIIITGGATALKKVVGAGAEKVVLQTTAKTVGGKVVKDVVTVSKEYRMFGRPIITKTLKSPTTLKETQPFALKQRVVAAVKRQPADIKPKISPVSSKGTYSLGSTKPATVLERSPIDPQGRGFELATGSKGQTKFNLKTLKELEKQGKISKRDVSMYETVDEGVKLVQKAPVKTFKAQVNLNALTTQQQAATFSAVRILQSPRNWLKGQRRVGKVGGSFSQESQLRPQYRKGDIHDLDIDVRSTPVATRAARTVYEKTSPFSTKESKITLDGKKVKLTTRKQDADEFVEFLDQKDAVQYQGANIETGLRFGQKFRDDKLSQYLKRPIKDPETGIKIRSLKDQAMAKGASVLSLQGGKTEKFVGIAKPEQAAWVAKQNRMIDEGILSVNPPALRGKDTIDLYKIFKSEAVGLKEGGKRMQGERLDVIAERLKKLNPELDFGGKSRGTGTYAPTSTSTATSLSVAEAKKGFALLGASQKLAAVRQPKTEAPKNRASLGGSVSRPLSASASKSLSVLRSKSLSASAKTASASTRVSSIGSPSASKGLSRTTSTKSIFSKVPKSKGTSKTSKQSKGSKGSPSKSASVGASKSASVGVSKSAGAGQSGRGFSGRTSIVNVSVRHPLKKRAVPLLIDSRNTTKRKKGKTERPHDFLGNVRLDQIEGMFRRKEVIHGDRSTIRQISIDKTKGFKQSKVKFF